MFTYWLHVPCVAFTVLMETGWFEDADAHCCMRAHTSTLQVSRRRGLVTRQAVCSCASLWLHPLWTCASGDKWPTGRHVQQHLKGVAAEDRAGSRRAWLPRRIDPPPSYLAPAKTHSSRIDWSLLHLIFTRSNNKARAKRSLPASKTSVFIKKSKAAVSGECWWAILQGGCELSGWKPHAGPLGGKNTESVILAEAAGASCYGTKTLKYTIQTRCIVRVIYCLECTGGLWNSNISIRRRFWGDWKA